jgi:regulator of replication initiation timing
MIKKAIIGSGAALLLALLFFGRDAASYVSTSTGYLKDSVKDSVPIEFEIERARRMVRDLVPEIRKNVYVIAKEEVEVERLQRQIDGAAANLSKDKDELLRLKTDLSSGSGSFIYAGRTYTAQQVKADLAARFDRYKTAEATLASLEEIHRARQRSLEAARQKLEAMLASKRQLQVEVENLEARLQMVTAAQTASNYHFDDSHLGRVKELISDLRTRLDVAERMVNAEGYFHDEIPLDETPPANIVEQVTDYFEQSPAERSALAGKETGRSDEG